MGSKGRKPKPSPSNQKWETALGNVTKVDSPFPFIEVFASKVAAWEGNESPDHWAHYKNICALAWTLLPQAAVSAGPGQCAAWAESPRLPTEVTTTHGPAQPLAARRDTQQASPVPMEHTSYQPERLCLVCWEAALCSPWRDLKDTASCQIPASFKDTLVLRSTAAEISSALHWQSSPCSVDREKVPCGVQHLHGAPVSFSPNSSIWCS